MNFLKPRHLEVVKPRAFSESDLNIALAAAADEHPIWRAVHQLIDVAEENANENAAASMDPPTVLAGYVGGAGHLRMLREELFNRRALGMEQIQKIGQAAK
jgi:hypothetical protein